MVQTTVTEQQRIRRKTGDTTTSFPDEDMDLVFVEASEVYASYTRPVWVQAVVVMRLRELWLVASRSVTYQQNETREQLSDMAKNLKALWEAEKERLDDLIDAQKPPAVAIGRIRRVPTRTREEPRS